MTPAGARRLLELSAELNGPQQELQELLESVVKRPRPGAFVKDARTDKLHKVYSRVGELLIDSQRTGGLVAVDSWLWYDTIQEPEWESDSEYMTRHMRGD